MLKNSAKSQITASEAQKSAVSGEIQEKAWEGHLRQMSGHGAGQQSEVLEDADKGTEELVSAKAVGVATIARRVELPHEFKLSAHAWIRMTSRGISAETVAAALTHGRVVHARGARHYVLGKREIAREKQSGQDLRRHEGIQVVALPDEPLICTVYRNRNFKQTLRPCGPRRRVHH